MRADKAQMELQQVRLCGVVRGVGRLRATALGDEWEAGKMRAEGARCSQGAVWRRRIASHQRRTTCTRVIKYVPSRAGSPDSALRTLCAQSSRVKTC